MRTFMKCLGAVLAIVWLGCVAIWLIEGENALGFFGVAFVLFVAFATLVYKILKSLAKSESDSPQNQKRRHLIATLGLAALAAVCFGLLTWAFVEGAVVEAQYGSTGTKGFGNATRYGAGGQLPKTALNIVHTREDKNIGQPSGCLLSGERFSLLWLRGNIVHTGFTEILRKAKPHAGTSCWRESIKPASFIQRAGKRFRTPGRPCLR